MKVLTVKMQWSLLITFMLCFNARSQAPDPALIGYFHNWNTSNAPYIQLDEIDSRYNIIDVAFAIPKIGTDYIMEFIPAQVSEETFSAQIQELQNEGKKVIISIGGATAPISLDNMIERDTFIATINEIINTYNFDGIDIDLEGSSLSLSGGTIKTPVDEPIINLIHAIKEIMATYHETNGKQLLLTMAPETAFVQGGQSAFGGVWGAYLPLIDALRDSIEILHVQLYNSGTMFGVDGNIYAQGTADFIVAMAEAVIQGFNTAGGWFQGLPANKIAVGLPACHMAAGGGYTEPETVKSALEYLRGSGIQPGSYSLINQSGYPDFRGMMTWSITWDASTACGPSYAYADNYEEIFELSTELKNVEFAKGINIYPNPTNDVIKIEQSSIMKTSKRFILFDSLGNIVKKGRLNAKMDQLDLSYLVSGVYYLAIDDEWKKIIKI